MTLGTGFMAVLAIIAVCLGVAFVAFFIDFLLHRVDEAKRLRRRQVRTTIFRR